MKILVVAGEASADMHAAHVLAAVKKKLALKEESLELFGIGGDQLSQLGLAPIRTAKEMAIVGLTEVIKKIPSTLRLLTELTEKAVSEKPDFALLLDLPDFNLRLAKRLKEKNIPVLYYISPQVWAWRSGRVKEMAKILDELLLILPFEKDWYEAHAPASLKTRYVGHPVVDEIPYSPYEPHENTVAILPGSRVSEWQRLFPVLLQAAVLLKKEIPSLRFQLPLAETLRGNAQVQKDLSWQGPYQQEWVSLKDCWETLEKPAYEIHKHAKLALIASGTATLEAGIVGVPMVVVYKVNPSSAFIFRHIVGYKGAVAIINLILKGLESQERVVPELLQEDCTPEKLAEQAKKILQNSTLWEKQREELAKTRALLSGEKKATENAAEAILTFRERFR